MVSVVSCFSGFATTLSFASLFGLAKLTFIKRGEFFFGWFRCIREEGEVRDFIALTKAYAFNGVFPLAPMVGPSANEEPFVEPDVTSVEQNRRSVIFDGRRDLSNRNEFHSVILT